MVHGNRQWVLGNDISVAGHEKRITRVQHYQYHGLLTIPALLYFRRNPHEHYHAANGRWGNGIGNRKLN